MKLERELIDKQAELIAEMDKQINTLKEWITSLTVVGEIKDKLIANYEQEIVLLKKIANIDTTKPVSH